MTGDVKFAEILMEKGRPSGEAVLRFGTEEDALRAISILYSETYCLICSTN